MVHVAAGYVMIYGGRRFKVVVYFDPLTWRHVGDSFRLLYEKPHGPDLDSDVDLHTVHLALARSKVSRLIM